MPIVLNGTTGITTPTYNGSTTAEYLVPVTGFKNRIINGDMTIDQRNAGASVTPANSAYTIDRWQATMFATSARFSVQQNAGSVTPPAGFRNYLGVTSLSAHSVTGNDIYSINQVIEGFNIADLAWGTANAKAITISFWVRSSLTGTFAAGLSNDTRSYPFTYTISSANTWEQKSVTIAGDTSGTWNSTNGNGVTLRFGLGAGSSSIFVGPAGAWASANYYVASGGTSVVGTNGATWYVTGVQLEVGSTATSFDYLPYGTELQLCQRYFYRLNRTTGGDNTVATGTNSPAHNIFVFKMPTELRTKPTITKTGTGLTVYSAGSNTPNPTLNSTTPGTQQSRIIFNLTGSSGNSCWLDLDNDNTYFDFSSEL